MEPPLHVIQFDAHLTQPLGGEENFERFLEESRLLARSWTARVYLCDFPEGNTYNLPAGEYAVKRHDDKSAFLNERYFLQFLRGENVADMVAFALDESITKYYIVLRYYVNGDLQGRVTAANGLQFSDILNDITQVAEILQLVHSTIDPREGKRMVYQDFKPQNFLVDGDRIRLCDLAPIQGEGDTISSFTSTYLEDVSIVNYFRGHDMYKFGLYVVAMITTQPIIVETEITFVNRVERGQRRVSDVPQRIAEMRANGVENLIRANLHSRIEDAVKVLDVAVSCFHEDHNMRPKSFEVVATLNAIRDRD